MNYHVSKKAMEDLIERSSLGSSDARRARARVSPVTGKVLARAAAQRSEARRSRQSRRSQG